MLDYRYLKVFMLTAKHSSFSKAAAELQIAQSAISRQIKLLEQSLQQELIIRSSKKVLLTDKGQELFLAAQDFETCTKNIFETEQKKTIRIGVLQGLLENWSHQILKRYYQNYENNITIRVNTPSKLKDLLQEGQLDLVLTNENMQSELISSTKLFAENLVLISKEKVAIDKIHQYRWIIYDREDTLIQAHRTKSERIVEVDDISTIVQLAKAGVGIAIVPDHVIEDRSNLCVQDFDSRRKSEIYLSTLNFKMLPKYLKELTQFIADQQRHQDYKKISLS